MTINVRKFDFIDALRGYAILGVIMVHSAGYFPPSSEILKTFFALGMRGVQLFYIASALTLCMSWEFRTTREKRPVRNFFIRRFFRIAPMFYLAIASYLFLYEFIPRHDSGDGIQWWFIPLTALFLNGYIPEAINSIVPGGWSVAVEMNFYLILPLLLQRLKTAKSLILFLCFSLGLYVASKFIILFLIKSYYPADQISIAGDFHYANFFGQLPVFATGLLTYFAYKNASKLKRIVCFSSIFWCFLILCTLMLPTEFSKKILYNHLFFGFEFALFALILSIYPIPLLVNKVIVQVGKLSFSLYLTHVAVLEFLNWIQSAGPFNFPDVPNMDISCILKYLCAVVLSSLLSWFFYKTIEQPGVALGKTIIDKLERDK